MHPLTAEHRLRNPSIAVPAGRQPGSNPAHRDPRVQPLECRACGAGIRLTWRTLSPGTGHCIACVLQAHDWPSALHPGCRTAAP